MSALRDWWAQFNDPALLKLIEQAEAGSPTLAQAWAKIEQARATLDTSSANALPSLSASASNSRSQTQTSLSTTRSAGLDASWELDLFGKLRRTSEAAQARVEARVADWHDARVSLAAEVADTYVQYRASLASPRTELPQPSALQVDSVPAQVLRQRPDLASLERELAVASATPPWPARKPATSAPWRATSKACAPPCVTWNKPW